MAPGPISLPARGLRPHLPDRQWIFGYGSLVDSRHLSEFLARHGIALNQHCHCELGGFKRTWSVAMNNALTLPGYKYYLDPATGDRPHVYVAFVNIERHTDTAEARIAGILFEVDAAALALLDAREHNYARHDVTADLSIAVEGTVWSYVGRPDAAARFRHGLATSSVVIEEAYKHRIEAAYARARLPFAAEMPDDIPSVTLTRVDT